VKSANKKPADRPEHGLSKRSRGPAFLFDLDGTLVDSVYQHVLAWREALESLGVELAVWRIHRRIGMSGGLLVNALVRETGRRLTAEEAARVQRIHSEAYVRRINQIRPLPGARELLAYLSEAHVPWAIATSGWQQSARRTLDLLGLPADVPVITRDLVDHAKPDPDLFLAAAKRLVSISATPSWLGTVSGICLRPGAPERSVSGSCRAGTERTNSCGQVHTESMPIRQIC